MNNTRNPKGAGTIYQRKDGSFCGQCTVSSPSEPCGKAKRITSYGKTKKEAFEKLMQKKKQWEQEQNNFNGEMLLSIWMQDWMNKWMKNSVRNKTWESYDSLIRCHIEPGLGYYTLNHLTPTLIQNFYMSKTEIKEGKRLSPRSIRYIHSVLSKSLKQAVLCKYISDNPAKGTTPPKHEYKERILPNDEQIALLLQIIQQERFYPLFLLAYASGLRRGEIVGLKWGDINYESRTISISRSLVTTSTGVELSEPKTKQSKRTIMISQSVMEELKRWKWSQKREEWENKEYYVHNDFVFCWEDGRVVNPSYISHRFTRILKKAKLPHLRFHDLRHIHATELLVDGINPKVVQNRLGHASINMTYDVYTQCVPQLQQAVVDAIECRLNSAIQPRNNKTG